MNSIQSIQPAAVFARMRPAVQKIVRDYVRRRGISSDELPEYLDPQLRPLKCCLPDGDKFVSRLRRAVDRHERVLIFGDYDCDGITSTTILLRFFRETTTIEPMWALPDRQLDHYGLDLVKAKSLFQQHQPSLLICVDNGTNSAEAIRWLKQRDVDTLVVDHHPLETNGTDAIALVNPKSSGDDQDDLCAAGLAFHLCSQMMDAWQCSDRWDRDTALVLASLATIADSVSMTPQNRALIKNAIRFINARHNLIPGLASLMPHDSGNWNQHRLQFEVIPALNALGRLASAEPSVELLTTADISKAQKIAAHCRKLNESRKAIQREMIAQATVQAQGVVESYAQAPVLILADRRWHHGVAGPAASRIAETFGRCAILLAPHTGDEWKGSGRTATGDHLGQWIHNAKHLGLLERGGGHAAAIGLAATTAQLAALHSAGLLLPVPECEHHAAEQEVIGELDQLHPEEWGKVVSLLEPFGQQNPSPLIACLGAICQSSPQPVLSRTDGQPWAVKAEFKTQSGRRFLVLNRNCAAALQAWQPGSRHDLFLKLTEKQSNGRTYVNWEIAAPVTQ